MASETDAFADRSTSLGAGASRPASLIVGLSVGAGLAVAAAATGSLPGVAVTAVAGAALGAAVLGRARGGPAWAAVASALTPVAALGGVAGVALVAADAGAVRALVAPGGTVRSLLTALPLALGAGLAGLGAVATLGDGLGGGALRGVWRAATTTATVVGAAFGALLATRFDALASLPVPGVDPGGLLGPVLAPTEPTVALASFSLLVVAAALAGRAALSTLPVAELVARRRRDAVRAELERVDAALARTVTYGVLATCVAALTVVPAVRAALPVRGVAALLASPGLRGAILALGVVAAGVTLAGRLLRAAAGGAAETLGRLLPATVGGGGVILMAVVGGGAVSALVTRLPTAARPAALNLLGSLSPTGAVLGATVFALTVLTGGVTALAVATAVGLVPTRGSGGALAGTGLALCGAAVGIGGGPALGVFAVVGLGVVAWDASDQGVAARADLGARSADRIEAVHAVGSLGVAALGVAAAWTASGLVGAVAMPEGVLVGSVVAVAGSVLLLGLLRG